MTDKSIIIKKHEELLNELNNINMNNNLMTIQECIIMIERRETLEMQIKQIEAIESTWNVQLEDQPQTNLKLFTSEEVGKLLNVPISRVNEFREIGMLQPIKIGKSYMYTPNDIFLFQETYKGKDISNKKKALIVFNDLKKGEY